MIETTLLNIIMNDAPITSLVGDEVHYQHSGNAKEPFIVIQILNGSRDYSFDGADDLEVARFQVSVWGKTKQDAATLREAVLNCLDDFTGSVIETGITIQYTQLDNWMDSIDLNAGQDANKRFGKELIFKVWYKKI